MEKLKLTKELKEFLENEGELGDGHSVVWEYSNRYRYTLMVDYDEDGVGVFAWNDTTEEPCDVTAPLCRHLIKCFQDEHQLNGVPIYKWGDVLKNR